MAAQVVGKAAGAEHGLERLRGGRHAVVGRLGLGLEIEIGIDRGVHVAVLLEQSAELAVLDPEPAVVFVDTSGCRLHGLCGVGA